MLMRIFLVYALLLIFHVFTENCEPKDEFDLEDISTERVWEDLMMKLNDLTFNRYYNRSCENDTTQTVVIDAKGNFLWNLRFVLYNETTNSHNKTMEDCYSVGYNYYSSEKKCEIVKFRQCMVSLREAMMNKIETSWENQIQKELEKLAKKC